MCAYDISRFVDPASQWEGLQEMNKDLGTANKAAALKKEQDDKNKLAGQKYFQNQFKGKEIFTGTPYDQANTDLLNQALSQSNELISKGVDVPTTQMAIQPLIEQSNIYSTNAKDYQLKKKNMLAEASKIPGIDITKFGTEMDNNAFPIDQKTGKPDLTQYDANTDYGDLALKNGDIYNNGGITDFVNKNTGKVVNDQNIVTRDANGGLRQTKADITLAPYMTPELDHSGVIKGFVPKYDIATDQGNAIVHNAGEQTGQPVRLLDENVFNQMMNDKSSATGAYILQETRKLAKAQNVDVNSPQGHMLAKAIAYDELNNNSKNSSSIKETSVNKSPLPDNYYAHQKFYAKLWGGGDGGAPIGNVYNDIQLQPNQKDGDYTMGGAGNKQNLGSLQDVFGKKLLPDYVINSTDPKDAINYRVKDGQVSEVQIGGKWYNRDESYNLQLSRDKEPLKGTHQAYGTKQAVNSNLPLKIKEPTNIKTVKIAGL